MSRLKKVGKKELLYWKVNQCLVLFDSATPWTAARQAPLSMGILQARLLEWAAMPSSRGSSWRRDQTQVSLIAGGCFTVWATREAIRNRAAYRNKELENMELFKKHKG